MRLSRRQFNRGAVALSGAAAMPPVPLSMRSGSDDAYETIISELVRVEEAAHAAGAGLTNSGAVTATGRKLEAFIGHLDLQVSPFETGGQIYRELRGFLNEQAGNAAKQAETGLKKSVGEIGRADDSAGDGESSVEVDPTPGAST